MQDEGSVLASLNLGTARSLVENKKGSPLELLLTSQVQKVVDRLHKSLDKYGIDASGSLKRDTAPSEITIEGNKVSIGIKSLDYWKYVNYGVNGTLINRGAPNHGSSGKTQEQFKTYISKWITDKGLTPQEGSSYESMNYAIRKHIREQGKEAKPFFDDVINDKLTEELRKPIEQIFKRSMEIIIVKQWQ